MKKISDLKEGDSIWVKCPYYINNPEKDGEWRQEKITKVEVGEDGYKGSGKWYKRIITDNSVQSCSDYLCDEGKHWSILFPDYTLCDVESNYIFQANGNRTAMFKILE